MTRTLGELVAAAHGDAWQVQGWLREPWGGAAAELPGARAMASGLPHPQWNNADVHDPAAVDLAVLRDWYAGRGITAWGVRVPSGTAWSAGRHLFAKRLMGLTPDRFVPSADPPGVALRRAAAADLEAVLAVDAVAFEEDAEVERGWVGPHLTAPGAEARIEVLLAEADGVAVGTAYSLRSDGWAGPALYVAGVAVLPSARRRGIGTALTSRLLTRGFATGAALAHLHPDTDEAARLYERLGFVEVPGFDVYVDL